ncbi:MAG: orotidine-5'-phosphate decarboxylase [Pseudomonadota bacterium]
MIASLSPKDRLIVALDVPGPDEALRLVAQLGDEVGCFKIGHQLAFAGGIALARELVRDGHAIFLDMKLLDIGNTVANGVRSIAKMGVEFLTIHAYPDAMKAAVEARGDSDLHLLAVTVLTSMDDDDVREAGYAMTAADLAAQRARQARDAGIDGLICSAQEVRDLRAIVGPDMRLVTPGIRPAGSASGDQKRVATPSSAIRDGADMLVVGRPITQAGDPADAARRIVGEIADALA